MSTTRCESFRSILVVPYLLLTHSLPNSIFYQLNPARLVVCLNTSHAWLHIPDYIESTGPGPSLWCWGCERACGRLTRAITSRKHPYASIDRRALEQSTLAVIRNTYDLQELLPVYSKMHDNGNRATFSHPGYPDITLLHPHKVISFVRDRLQPLKLRISAHLCTLLEVPAAVIRSHMSHTFEQYGRVLFKKEGTIYATEGTSALAEGRRNATFLQYELRVDEHASDWGAEPSFDGADNYGQLERAIVVDLPASDALGLTQPTTYILFDIHTCNTTEDDYGFYEYTRMGKHEIIDGSAIRASVGRIFDRGKWVIVKRPNGLEHAEWDVDNE